jgi:peroxin-6
MVTVSRICSPLSVDRQFQPLFLHALKLYFEQARRIVCSGDVIAIPINAALARLLPPAKDDAEAEVECAAPVDSPVEH